MKFRLFLLMLSLTAILLSACVFPLQRISPDPVAPVSETSVPEEFPSPLPDDVQMPLPEELSPEPRIEDARLAVFWYAMADAHVYDLREVFDPVLEQSGIPFREYDAENDRYRQLDQVREAIAGGWNILAVQLVAVDSSQAANEIIKVAEGYPVIFFDRTPENGITADSVQFEDGTAGLICSDPADTGLVQGSMIGAFLLRNFSETDGDSDGSVSYTMLLENPDSPTELNRSQTCVETVNALLEGAGYPPLRYFDPQSSEPYQSDPSAQWASDAANAIMRNHLLSGDPVELVIADSDELALGALTALQADWCNLGDGNTRTVPLFGIGASSAARSAVSLGQMSGTVDWNAPGYATALVSTVQGLANGRSLSECFSELTENSDYTAPSGTSLPTLCVLPLPVSPELFR